LEPGKGGVAKSTYKNGPIFNNGNMMIPASVMAADHGSAGGAVYNLGQMSLSKSLLSDNGAIHNEGAATTRNKL